jgi:hypothetical protein
MVSGESLLKVMDLYSPIISPTIIGNIDERQRACILSRLRQVVSG